MAVKGASAARRVALESLGWVLVVAGIAALVLPGPGLLMIFAGMAILSQQYEWAEKRLEPVKEKALTAAEESVETWPRIVLSVLSGLVVHRRGGHLGPAPAGAVVVAARREVVAVRWLGHRLDPDHLGHHRPRPGGVQLPPVPPGLTSRTPLPRHRTASGQREARRPEDHPPDLFRPAATRTPLEMVEVGRRERKRTEPGLVTPFRVRSRPQSPDPSDRCVRGTQHHRPCSPDAEPGRCAEHSASPPPRQRPGTHAAPRRRGLPEAIPPTRVGTPGDMRVR